MKPLKALWLSGFLLCLAACGDPGKDATSQAAQPEPAMPPEPEREPCALIMGWDPWEPYQYEIAGGQVFGLDVDLVSAVTREAGCTLTFRKGTWRELLQQLQDGDIHLLAGATRTPEREAFARFTEPYRNEEFLLFLPSEALESVAGQDLAAMMGNGMRLGVVEGYLYGDEITALQDDAELESQFLYTAMAETNFSRLLDGEVEGVIEDRYVGAAIIRHKDLSEAIATHPVSLNSSPVRIMVSRATISEENFFHLDRSVRILKNNGAIDKILAQYGAP